MAWRHPARVAAAIADESERSGLAVTWLNHWSVLHADWDALSRASIVAVDGTLLQALLRAHGIHVGRSSADLTIPRYLELKPESRLALIGGVAGVAERAALRLPGTVFTADGFDQLQALRRDPSRLIAARATVVVLGLGAGLQDRVAVELREALPDAVVFTAGGWLDQMAVREQYFPAVIHSLRLGWLWRVAQEPRRLGRRYTVDALAAAAGFRRIASLLREHLRPIGDVGFAGLESAGVLVPTDRGSVSWGETRLRPPAQIRRERSSPIVPLENRRSP